ncbi:hypothetical protein [Alistipes sp.]|uniref:hypothetical protein n=1 Tax=Alistipes sp. TaxID=1872444 RepID=UPI003AB46155
MKKLLLLLVSLFFVHVVLAQHVVFCQIVGTQKFAKSEVTVGIDFGQEGAMRTNIFGGVAMRNKLVGEDGKPISFNSMVDAMNYMGSLGWKFEQAYVVSMPSTMGGGQNVYHWLLSKSISEDENINDGFTIKSQVTPNPNVTEQPDSAKNVQDNSKKRNRPGVWPDI